MTLLRLDSESHGGQRQRLAGRRPSEGKLANRVEEGGGQKQDHRLKRHCLLCSASSSRPCSENASICPISVSCKPRCVLILALQNNPSGAVTQQLQCLSQTFSSAIHGYPRLSTLKGQGLADTGVGIYILWWFAKLQIAEALFIDDPKHTTTRQSG